jgi:hypothetical protein
MHGGVIIPSKQDDPVRCSPAYAIWWFITVLALTFAPSSSSPFDVAFSRDPGGLRRLARCRLYLWLPLPYCLCD